MKELRKEKRAKRPVGEKTTFAVPQSISTIHEEVSLKKFSNLSKEQIIEKGTNEHIKNNTKEAENYYRYFLEQGFEHPIVLSNYGIILKAHGKFKEAEKLTRKAIKLKPDFAEAYLNLGNILRDIGKLEESKILMKKAIKLKPNYLGAAWNLYGLADDISEAIERINLCLEIDENFIKAKIILSGLKLHQGDSRLFDVFLKSDHKSDPYIRSFKWVKNLSKTPKLFFHRWGFFDYVLQISMKSRPFYEFGVWRGNSFRYLIKTLKIGYGFDTFEGLPEDWHNEKKGAYSAEGFLPKIKGGTFIKGKFEDSLPNFFKIKRPLASIINFDADLYSSTLCALNYSKSIIDKNTILIFDEFISNKNWEQDEYKALNEFCLENNINYEVIAISYMTKQVALKLKWI
tara:strand:- start:594 stop:1796 length:1203 start_codon:yes stop_codon:yes gene_type:complete